MSKTEITNKVRELKELKAMADELAAEITAIEDSIKVTMTAQGVEEIAVDIYKVRYKTVKSSRIDTTALKKPCRSLPHSLPRKPKAAALAWFKGAQLMKTTIEIPVETAAALILACIAIEDILTLKALTEDIKDELTHIRPYLNGFMEMAQ